MDYSPLLQQLHNAGAGHWAELLPQQIDQAFDIKKTGRLHQWRHWVDTMPVYPLSSYDFTGCVRLGVGDDVTDIQRETLKRHLMQFSPWRKGPFEIAGILIDSEWRSDWKWGRLSSHIQPLVSRRVLDIGCGNGYYSWRMLGAGASLVVGIDPMLLSVMQFHAVKELFGEQPPVYVLPLAVEQIPLPCKVFDTVFSMGVLYHRRSPIDHLYQLKSCLREGGELVLETLVVAGDLGHVLVPEGRYAQMRNVWFIPSCETLMSWMKRVGFADVRVVDVAKTTCDEQRQTEWMTSHSLAHFLDSENPELTCEGLPAPVRAIFLATA